MNNFAKNKTSFLLAAAFVLAASATTKAERHAVSHLNYDRIAKHCADLECVSEDLRELIRADFRYSRVYGKLLSRTNKIRHRVRSLHRRALSRGSCNWKREVHRIDDLVCELVELVDEAIYRSKKGLDQPIHRSAARHARRLLDQARRSSLGLKRALSKAQAPVHHGRYSQLPYRSGSHYQSASRYQYHSVANRSGLSVSVGGLKFYINR